MTAPDEIQEAEPTTGEAPEFPNSRFARAFIVITVVTTYVAPIVFIALMETDLKIAQLISRFPAAFLGIPWCGGAASMLVVMFSKYSGRIRFSGLGLKFEGAAAPILFWAITFLCFIAALKLLTMPQSG